MKYIINFLILMFFAAVAIGQQKPPYDRTTTNQVMADRATWSRYFMGIPKGPTPNIPAYIPDSLKCGALFYNTTDNSMYQYDCSINAWVKNSLSSYKLKSDSVNNDGYFTNSKFHLLGLSKLDTISLIATRHWVLDSVLANNIQNQDSYSQSGSFYIGNTGTFGDKTSYHSQISAYSLNFDQADGEFLHLSTTGGVSGYGNSNTHYDFLETGLSMYNGVGVYTTLNQSTLFLSNGSSGTVNIGATGLNLKPSIDGSQYVDLNQDGLSAHDNNNQINLGSSGLSYLNSSTGSAYGISSNSLQLNNGAQSLNIILNTTNATFTTTDNMPVVINKVNVGDSTINQTIIWRGNSQHLAVKRADIISNSQSYAYLVSQAMGYRQVNQGWGGRTDQQSTASVDSSLFYTVTKLPLPYFKSGTIYVLGVFANDITNDTTHYKPALWQTQMTAVVDSIQAHGALVVFQNPGYEGGYLGYPNHTLDMESRHAAYYTAMQNVAAATGCLYYDDWSAMKPFAAQYVTTIDFIHITAAGNAWEAGRFTTFLQAHFTSHPWTVKNNVYGNQYIEGNQIVQNSITTNQLTVTGGANFPFADFQGQVRAKNADHSGNTSNFVAGGDITGHTITNGVNKSGNFRGYTYADTTGNLSIISYSATSSQSLLYIGYDAGAKYNPTDIIFAVSPASTTVTASIPALHVFSSGGTTLSTVTETDPGAGNFRITGSLLFKNDNLSIIGSAAMNAATVFSRIFRSGSTLTLNAGGSNVLIGTSGTGQVTLPFYTGQGSLLYVSTTTGLLTSTGALTGLLKMNGTSVPTASIAGTDFISPSGTETMSNKTFSDKLRISTSANAGAGLSTLTAGAATISNTNITASSIILLSRKTAAGAVGTLSYTVSAGTGFTITSSSSTDTSVISYLIIN